MSPLSSEVIGILEGELSSFLSGNIGSTINSNVKTALSYQIDSLLSAYQGMGFHLIGRWEYNKTTETYSYSGLTSIFSNKLLKYYPYLKVLNNEFIATNGEETKTRQYVDSGTETKQEAKGKNYNRSDNFTNETYGANRSAHEDSPITAAVITNAPSDSTSWNLSNPSAKDGEQFDHHNSSASQRADTVNETKSENNSNSGMGNSSETIANPEMILKVLRFNVENLNISRIARLIVDSVIEEKNTIF